MLVVLTLPVRQGALLGRESCMHVDFVSLLVCYSCAAPMFSSHVAGQGDSRDDEKEGEKKKKMGS